MIGRPLRADLREKAYDHVDRLARRLGAEVKYLSTTAGVVDTDTRRIHTPPIESAYNYLAALHELGHLASKRRSTCPLWDHEGEIVDEAAAWAWARKRADAEILATMTKSSWQRVAQDWLSYVR